MRGLHGDYIACRCRTGVIVPALHKMPQWVIDLHAPHELLPYLCSTCFGTGLIRSGEVERRRAEAMVYLNRAKEKFEEATEMFMELERQDARDRLNKSIIGIGVVV